MNDNDKILFSEIAKDCKKVISKEVNEFISDKSFNLSDCDFMMNHLSEKILKEVRKISINFKYIVNVIFLQNDDNGFTQNMALHYDPETDGCITEKYSFPEICCVVNLFCTSI